MKANKKQAFNVPNIQPPFKRGEPPHIGERVSFCGKRGYLHLSDARRLEAAACGTCGLYHTEKP